MVVVVLEAVLGKSGLDLPPIIEDKALLEGQRDTSEPIGAHFCDKLTDPVVLRRKNHSQRSICRGITVLLLDCHNAPDTVVSYPLLHAAGVGVKQ
ncbi:hypothetical protein D3C75_699180 [compost metagenome]